MLWSSGDELDDDTYSRTCYIYIPLFELLCTHCMLLMWAVTDVLWWCNVCKQIYLILSKDYLLSIIFYSAAMVRFWCWFCFLFFYLFFLNPNGSYFCATWVDCCRIVLTQGVRICGPLQLVSEHRLVITFALVGITHKIESVVLYNEFERINRYERVFVSEYKLF